MTCISNDDSLFPAVRCQQDDILMAEDMPGVDEYKEN